MVVCAKQADGIASADAQRSERSFTAAVPRLNRLRVSGTGRPGDLPSGRKLPAPHAKAARDGDPGSRGSSCWARKEAVTVIWRMKISVCAEV